VVGLRESAENGNPLDALIDDTARSMTEGAPSPSMRVAIRERVEAPRKGMPHVTGRLVWTGAAAAAVVLLIVGLEREDAPAPVVPGSPPAVVAVPDAPPPPEASIATTPRAPAPRARVAPARVAVPAAPDIMTTEPAVASAEDALVIELVEIEPLVSEPLELELMEVPMPLRAERIEIDPLPVE